MRDVLIAIADLYLPRTAEPGALPAIGLPGLEHVARFGRRSPLRTGWRQSLAGWLAGEAAALSDLPTAVVAAIALPEQPPAAESGQPSAALGASQALDRLRATAASTVWMATPVHLVASLTSLHMDRRSVLRLTAAERAALAGDFEHVFRDGGYRLAALGSGEFLLFMPELPQAQTWEPVRAMGESIAEGLPVGPGAAALRKVGAEIEMWLHGHPLNEARRLRGEPTVTGLWLWGGGTVPRDWPPHRAHGVSQHAAPGSESSAKDAVAFGTDAYVCGLWASWGEEVRPLPRQFTDIFGYAPAKRAVLVLELGRMLDANREWSWPDAAAQVDRHFVLPAVHALQRGALERLEILANDVRLSLRARDRFRLWRRPAPGLSGLI